MSLQTRECYYKHVHVIKKTYMSSLEQFFAINAGGVQPHFCPWKNVCFPIFPHREKWEKSIWKEREKYSFPSLFIYFFPHGKKWENTHFSMGKNGVGPPPPNAKIENIVFLIALKVKKVFL